jgi:hypothetical protein
MNVPSHLKVLSSLTMENLSSSITYLMLMESHRTSVDVGLAKSLQGGGLEAITNFMTRGCMFVT